MKVVFAFVVTLALTACGTLGGAIEGAGQDLGKAGQYIKKAGN